MLQLALARIVRLLCDAVARRRIVFLDGLLLLRLLRIHGVTASSAGPSGGAFSRRPSARQSSSSCWRRSAGVSYPASSAQGPGRDERVLLHALERTRLGHDLVAVTRVFCWSDARCKAPCDEAAQVRLAAAGGSRARRSGAATRARAACAPQTPPGRRRPACPPAGAPTGTRGSPRRRTARGATRRGARRPRSTWPSSRPSRATLR